MYNPIGKFPNHIFIPKIVPLVYDDTLSYYEFLCKVLNKLNEAIETLNTLGEKVDILEEQVRQIQLKINEFEGRISQNESDIAYLQGVVVDLNNAISSINTAIDNLENQVEDNTTNIGLINTSISTINSTISDIQDAIANLDDVPGQITVIEGDITSLDVRVTNLEGATYGTVTANPMNVNFSYDMRNLDGVDFDIVKISGDFTDDDIYVDDTTHKITFNHGDDDNICKLVLHNVLTDIDNFIDIDTQIVNLVFLVVRAGSYTYTSFSNGLTISQLLTGYTGNEYFRTIKLVRNSTGNFDLEIQQYPQTYYLKITLDFMFITFGQAPMTQTMVKDFIGNPSQNLLGIIKKNSKNYDTEIANINTTIDAMGIQVTNNGIAINNEATARQTADNTLSGRITTNSNAISSLQSAVGGVETVNTWYNFSDVFEDSNFPPNAHIHYFKCQKVNKVVTMEIAGRGFTSNNDFRFSTFYLGKLRDGVRNMLAPKDGKEVTCFGVTTDTNNSGQNIGVTGATADPNRSPIILSGNTLAIGVLTGSETANPWTWASYTEAVLKPYSLMVNTNGLFMDTQHNAFVIRFTYVTN